MITRYSKAFTLIELLVVIAIIAILAAILFPVFAQARESARTSSCSSNEKQLTLAVIQYVQDYDEKFPFGNFGIPTTDPAYHTIDTGWGAWKRENFGWDHLITPYTKNTQIGKCPSANDGPDSGTTDPAALDSWRTGATQYWMNRRLVGFERTTDRAAKLAAMSFPASTLMIGENSASSSTGAINDERGGWGYADGHSRQLNGNGNAGANGDWNDDVSVPANDANKDALCHNGDQKDATTGSGPAALRRHKGGANYGFGDGHVKWFSGDASCAVWDKTKNRSGQGITYFAN